MAKKKVDDVVADFFGTDDADWLADPSEEISKADVPVAAAPKAPVDDVEDEESETDAPTTMFSPEQFGDFSSAPLATGGPLESLPEGDDPTLELDPTSEEVPIEMVSGIGGLLDLPEPGQGIIANQAEAPVEDDEGAEEPDGEEGILDVLDEGFDLTPSEVSEEAAPVSEELAEAEEPEEEQDAEPEATEVAPLPERPAAPPVEHWEPASDADAWREAAVALVAEAAAQEDLRGSLLFEAARIYRTRLGDDEGARALTDDALSAGLATPELHELRMQIGQTLADDALALESATARAQALEGGAAADAWRTVASLAGDDVDEAVAALNEASDADPTDYTALSELVGLLRGDEDQIENLLYALGRMAELATGTAAAELHQERGDLLAKAGRELDAQGAWKAARLVLPSHQPSLVALSASFRRIGLHAEAAELFQSEADRADQPDPGHWHLLVARSRKEAGDEEAAEAAYLKAAEMGSTQAQREYVAWLAAVGRHETLITALRAQAEASADGQKPFAVYRLARALEAAEQHDAALEAYRQVAILDPESRPAVAAVERVLRAKGDSAELRAFWSQQVEGDVAPGTKVSLLHRIGEEAESAGDQQAAREAMEGVLEVDAGFIPAIEALQRVYTRQEAWAELAELHDRRAALTTDKPQRALFLHRAGSVHHHRLADTDAARKRYEEALKLVPDHAASLDALLGLLEASEDWKGLSMRLFKAGQAAAHEASKVSLLYRASRVLVDRVDNPRKATALLKQVLQVSPDFAPARALLADLSGGQTYRELEDEAATAAGRAKEWLLLAASEAARGEKKANPSKPLTALLTAKPVHAAGMAELERYTAETGERKPLAAAYQRALDLADSEAEACRLGSALAELHLAMEAPKRVTKVLQRLANEAASAPMAVVAAGQGDHKTAFALLAGLESPAEVLARAWNQATVDPEGAISELETLYEGELAGAAAELALRVGAKGGSRLHALQVLALQDGPIAGTARLRLLEESPSPQVPELEAALAARPTSASVFRLLRKIRIEDKDLAGIRSLYEAYRPDDVLGLADALEASGDPGGAAAIWAARTDLASLLRTERLSASAENWAAVLVAIEAQEALATDEGFKSTLAARKRWVLANHLAETDAAWEAYRALHEDNPDDREVTRALARIAGKRGDTELGIQYLRELARSAETPEESASFQREIGGVYEDAGSISDARQAYLDALDHVRDDAEAISGLKRIAEGEEDWSALVQVLQREVGLVGEERRVEVLREIALVTETKLDDSALAVERWREVLEASPDDVEGLEHTLALSADGNDWALFVDVGARLAEHRSGRERAELFRRVGIASEEQLGRKDAERYFTAALEAAPDAIAAKRLEKLRRRFGDWSGAVQMLVTQAEAATSFEEKVKHIEEAARIEAEQRHDSGAASALYGRLLEWEPDHRAALLYQSEYLFKDGDFHEALPVYAKLEVQYDGDDVDLDDFDERLEASGYFYRYAELLRAAGQSEESLTRYQRALSLNPAHLPSLEAVGPLYMQRKQYKLGQAVWRQLLQLTGGHGDKNQIAFYYTQLGLVEHALGNSSKASKRFSKALELNPAHVGALKGMAILLEEREDWNNLLNFYNNIIYHATSSQDVVDAYLTKGRVLDECLERPDKAAQHYDRLLAFDANQPRALLRLGEVRAREADWDRAAASAARGLRVAKSASPLRATLALLHALSLGAKEMPTEAEEAWAEAEKADSSAVADLAADDTEAVLARVRERLQF